jgi:hypothetical protein
MNRAFGAGGFSLSEGAVFKPFGGIVLQIPAIITQFLSAMILPAIHGNHCFYGIAFMFYTFTPGHYAHNYALK